MCWEMKCTQCGCIDLEEVDFPYEAQLRQVYVGIAGESSEYDLEEVYYTTTYICTKCGHFEFFNLEWAKSILEERIENKKVQDEIEKLETKILENNCEIDSVKKQIENIEKQLEDLDITIRQSIELKTKMKDLKEKIELLEKENRELLDMKYNLEHKDEIDDVKERQKQNPNGYGYGAGGFGR